MFKGSKLHSEDDFLDDLNGGKHSEQITEKILYITISKLFGLRKEFEGKKKYITATVLDKKSSTCHREEKEPNFNETIAFSVKRRPHLVAFYLYYVDEKNQHVQLGEGAIGISEELNSEECQTKLIFEDSGYVIASANIIMMYQKPKKK